MGVEWCEADYWVIDTAYYVTPNTPDLDLKFFYYLVKYIGLNHLKDGTSNPSLSRDTFSAQLLPFPPIAEQKQIAHILGTLDDKIELNQQMNRTLEGIARARFKSWFIDFDPVRAKLDGRQPSSGMDAETAALFPDVFEDSALGTIPQGWQITSFESLFLVPLRNGLTKPKRVRGLGTYMVNMGELFGHRRIGNIEMERVPLTESEANKTLLQVGDLLFARQS